jgi:2-dehydropantoate 2-reductase
MRVLVIGAGVLGSLYAGRLAAAGNEVALFARGSRLAELQGEPLRLVNDADGTCTRARRGRDSPEPRQPVRSQCVYEVTGFTKRQHKCRQTAMLG